MTHYTSDSVRQGAVSALGGRKDARLVEPLIVALTDPVPEVRATAASELGYLCDPRAADALLHALQDTEAPVRRNAAGALGHLKEPRAIQPLLAALQDADPSVRRAAAEACGSMRLSEAVPKLLAMLSATDEPAQIGAARALASIGDPRAVEALVTKLRPPHATKLSNARWEMLQALIRFATAKPLGSTSRIAALEGLVVAVGDPDERVRAEAVRTLCRISGEVHGEDPAAWASWLRRNKDALEKGGALSRSRKRTTGRVGVDPAQPQPPPPVSKP